MDDDECCCEMKGFLSFLVLSLIEQKSRNGEEIARELEKRKGEKPSPGTIYPVLKHLKQQGFLVEKKEGKSIVYSLTERGTQSVRAARKKFKKIFSGIT